MYPKFNSKVQRSPYASLGFGPGQETEIESAVKSGKRFKVPALTQPLGTLELSDR